MKKLIFTKCNGQWYFDKTETIQVKKESLTKEQQLQKLSELTTPESVIEKMIELKCTKQEVITQLTNQFEMVNSVAEELISEIDVNASLNKKASEEFKVGDKVEVTNPHKRSFEMTGIVIEILDVPDYNHGTIRIKLDKFESDETISYKKDDLKKVASLNKQSADFPFNQAIDFRYIAGKKVFNSTTEEYKLLEELQDDEWERYVNILAGSGVIVEYNLVKDEYDVDSLIGANLKTIFIKSKLENKDRILVIDKQSKKIVAKRYIDKKKKSKKVKEEKKVEDKKEKKSRSKEASLSKKAGMWSAPYTKAKAEKLQTLINTLDKGDFLIDDLETELYGIFGSDPLYDDLDALRKGKEETEPIKGSVAKDIIIKHVKELVKDWKDEPGIFSKEFEPESITILENIIK